MIVHKGYIYREAAKRIFYHGASSAFLRRILKMGLIPNPKNQVWAPDQEGGHSPGIISESLPGSYWALNFRDAAEAANDATSRFPGHPVIIAAQIETTAPPVAVDEDITIGARTLMQAKCLGVSDAVDLADLVLVGIDWYDFAQCFIDEIFEQYFEAGMITGPQVDQAVEALAPALEWQTYEYLYSNRDQIDPNKLEAILGDLDYAKIAAQHRQLWDEAFRKLKFLTEPFPGSYSHAVRVTEPVTYRGANRILSVVEYWKDGKQWLYKVRYDGDGPTTNKTVSQIKRRTKAKEAL